MKKVNKMDKITDNQLAIKVEWLRAKGVDFKKAVTMISTENCVTPARAERAWEGIYGDEEEETSECCGAYIHKMGNLCSKCLEHC